jgi:flavodoxin
MVSEFSIPAFEDRHERESDAGFSIHDDLAVGCRTLVAYYSLSGHTRELAGQICEASAGHLEEIAEPRPRHGLSGEVRALVDSLLRRAPPIRTPRRDPAQYDLLLLGGPVWAGRIAAPVRSYVQALAARATELAFFCTYDTDGAMKALQELADLCGRRPRAVLAVPAHALVSGAHRADLHRFVHSALAPRARLLATGDSRQPTPSPT